MSKFTITALTLFFCGFSLSAFATEPRPLEAEELISTCQSIIDGESKQNTSTENSGICRGYILGYFAASNKIIMQEDIPSNLTLRAMKTRGVRLSEEQNKLLTAPYCISKTETVESIARKIVSVEPSIYLDKSSADILEYVLYKYYQCAAD